MSQDDIEYWAFRCFDETKNLILCNLYSYNKATDTLHVNCLNKLFTEKFNERPADPKLFVIRDKICCTLNSGFVSEGQNSVYFMNIDIQVNIHNLKKCIIQQRNSVEKNWSFFEQNGILKLLYSISPICKVYILKAETEQELFFELEKETENKLPEYSIGTQPQIKNGFLYLITHKKYFFNGKRLYIGIPAKVNMSDLTVILSTKKIVHSLLTLLGSKFKFNKNLISCTYFSGLQISDENDIAKITYGVNDISWSSSKIKIEKLWR